MTQYEIGVMAGTIGWLAGVLEFHARVGGGLTADEVRDLHAALVDRAERAGLDVRPVLPLRPPEGRRAPRLEAVR